MRDRAVGDRVAVDPNKPCGAGRYCAAVRPHPPRDRAAHRAFTVSWGPVRWVMLPELFPMRIRAAAVVLCVLFDWLFSMIVST